MCPLLCFLGLQIVRENHFLHPSTHTAQPTDAVLLLQMMLVGASLTLARAVGSFGEAASRMLEPCERAMREAASLAVSEAPEASSLQSALQAAQQAVARINAVVRSARLLSSKDGSV